MGPSAASHGSLEAVIEHSKQVVAQVRRLETKIERETLMLAPLPTLALRIVEVAREHGRVTMADAIKLTGASRNTLKLHFRALVERGYLHERGQGRGVWYELAPVGHRP